MSARTDSGAISVIGGQNGQPVRLPNLATAINWGNGNGQRHAKNLQVMLIDQNGWHKFLGCLTELQNIHTEWIDAFMSAFDRSKKDRKTKGLRLNADEVKNLQTYWDTETKFIETLVSETMEVLTNSVSLLGGNYSTLNTMEFTQVPTAMVLNHGIIYQMGKVVQATQTLQSLLKMLIFEEYHGENLYLKAPVLKFIWKAKKDQETQVKCLLRFDDLYQNFLAGL